MSLNDVDSSNGPAAPVDAGAAPIDRLTPVLERFRVQASLFHSGPLCGHQVFDAKPGRGFLHVLRRGEMDLLHGQGPRMARTHLAEPTLLFFPRAVHHEFVNAPVDGSDFTCATLDFDGGARNPIVQSLPDLIALPLERIDGLGDALNLLFAESDQARCGSRLLVNRLFEVVLIQVLRHLMERGQTRSGMLAGLAHPRLRHAVVAMHERPAHDWTLDALAGEAGMSRSVFAMQFRDAVGCTPGTYLQQWRVGLAQRALRAGRPLKLIAQEVGYGSEAALSRAFKAQSDHSPREWKLAQQPAA